MTFYDKAFDAATTVDELLDIHDDIFEGNEKYNKVGIAPKIWKTVEAFIPENEKLSVARSICTTIQKSTVFN